MKMAFSDNRSTKSELQHEDKGDRSAGPTDKKVGENIRTLRIASGRTLAVLAAELGLSHQQLQKYETSANRISAGRLWDVSKVLDVPIAELYQGVE